MSELRRAMDEGSVRPRSLLLPDFASASRPPDVRSVRHELIEEEQHAHASALLLLVQFAVSDTTSDPLASHECDNGQDRRLARPLIAGRLTWQRKQSLRLQ
jgi:hypothetical protein